MGRAYCVPGMEDSHNEDASSLCRFNIILIKIPARYSIDRSKHILNFYLNKYTELIMQSLLQLKNFEAQ